TVQFWIVAVFLFAPEIGSYAMPHRFIDSIWPGFGLSGGVYVLGILAQAVTASGVDWVNVGAVGAITALFAYIITKRDRQIQEKHTEILKHLADKEAERDKHRSDKEAERQKHLTDVFAAENESQREQFNVWMDQALKLVGHSPISHTPKGSTDV